MSCCVADNRQRPVLLVSINIPSKRGLSVARCVTWVELFGIVAQLADRQDRSLCRLRFLR